MRGLRAGRSPWRPPRRCHSANGRRPTTAARTALGRGVARGRRRGRELGGAALPIGGSACSSHPALRPLVRSPAAEPIRTPRPSPSCQSPGFAPPLPGLGAGLSAPRRAAGSRGAVPAAAPGSRSRSRPALAPRPLAPTVSAGR